MFGDVDVMSVVLEYVSEPFNVQCKNLFVDKFCRYRAPEIFSNKSLWRSIEEVDSQENSHRRGG